MRWVATIALSFLIALTGCGSHVETDPGDTGDGGIFGAGGSGGSSTLSGGCPAFSERYKGHCRPVVVRDVDEKTVWFESGGYKLPGTLALPVTDGEYEAVGAIIIHGTGPGPRDGTASTSLGFAYPEPVHTYENLALTLARAGLAVLRYDKRSCFHEKVHACKNTLADYPGDPATLTLDDFAADARAAAEFVSARDEVRDSSVVAIGHSEGGVLVTALLAESSVVRSAVLLGAPSMSFESTASGQLEVYADHLEEQGPSFEQEVAALRAKAETWRTELEQIRNGTYPESTWEGASLSYVRSTLEWYDSLEQRFVAADAPMLVLAGSSDFNVWPEHFEGYQELAVAHDVDQVSLHLLPDVTHAFCLKPDAGSWAPFEPTLAPDARDRLVSWLRGGSGGIVAH